MYNMKMNLKDGRGVDLCSAGYGHTVFFTNTVMNRRGWCAKSINQLGNYKLLRSRSARSRGRQNCALSAENLLLVAFLAPAASKWLPGFFIFEKFVDPCN